MKICILAISVLGLSTVVTACSNRAVYDNMRIYQRNQCQEQPIPNYADCLERASKPYEVYQRELDRVLEQ